MDTISQTDEGLLRTIRFQDADGRIVISWRLVWAVCSVAVTTLALSWLFGEGPGWAASMTGFLLLTPFASWRRSSARHRVVVGVGFVLALTAPACSLGLLPLAERHRWYPAMPVAGAALVLAIAAYVALTRLPGCNPPLPDPEAAERKRHFKPSRPWTLKERRGRLGDAGELVFCHRWSAAFQTAFLGILTVVCLGLIVAAFATGTWFGGLVLIPACASLVYATWRAPHVALVIDADGLTVRNMMGTQRVSWDYVRTIVPPDDDWFGRLRLKLINGASISAAGLTTAGIGGGPRRRKQVDEILALWGPPEHAQPTTPGDCAVAARPRLSGG